MAAATSQPAAAPAPPTTTGSGAAAKTAAEEEARVVHKCQFPGCEADLAKLKRYNLRCKICDEHRLADSLLIGGVESRFCQQCNRFHSMDFFDKGKRGCRDKLEKHNKRRRFNRRAKAGLTDEPLLVPGLTAPIQVPGGFMENVSAAAKQMQVPDDAAKTMFSNIAAAAAAAGSNKPDAAGAAVTVPQALPGGLQLPAGILPAGGVPAPGAEGWDPNNRQNFQNYVLLAAYAAYMSGFPS